MRGLLFGDRRQVDGECTLRLGDFAWPGRDRHPSATVPSPPWPQDCSG